MLEGTIVHSLDLRDDPQMFYVVIESDIHCSSGLCDKIAEVGREEFGVYRLQRLLVDATDETKRLAREAADLAPKD
jgi:hypothetical protein